MFIDKKQWVDPTKNPILKGNFAPVKEENSYEVIEVVEGAVPDDINGVYLRNGPNPKFMPATNRNHWFDGDSMIHAFRIKNGQMFYCNRYTQTPKLLQEIKAGKALTTRAGELFTGPGLIKALLYEVQSAIGYLPHLE
jgi:carotenoid cleavage dioxygenase-like enzyme